MKYSVWSDRSVEHGVPSAHLHDDADESRAVFPLDVAQHPVATVGQGSWELKADKHSLAATLPDGRVFQATTGAKPFGRSKRIDVDLAGVSVAAVNEAGQDWVYVDSADEKLGQFSGGNNGVRKSITEFEESSLSDEQKVFLSWVTKTALEAKMLSGTLVLTICLLLVIPVVIFGLV
ncbi:MAG: hypothetical protein Q4A31_10950 [Corynebacterium sp.]|uniref:hypothetical protein n=1 Tax=Corynebacterium sp. TaxID=1720 RepID=UPI0026DB6A07|nr:hypothetical protein [Corynebacterium sp.]MDO4762427.1 hypothetical protein [Corynebacterium sp.]